jgi:hypothetical protein
MISSSFKSAALAKSSIVLGMCALFLAADSAFGQGTRGSPRTRGQRQRAAPGQAQQQSTRTGDVRPGAQYGRIAKFKPAEESSKGDEGGGEVIGTLLLRPVEKGAKTLRLEVKRSRDLRVSLDDHEFEIEEIQ